MKKIAVLMGGQSSERTVSLESGKGVIKALSEKGYEPIALDVPEKLSGLVCFLEENKPDAVFNALHGKYGEDGCIQGLLNLMRIPYTHSGVLASALSMNKQKAKALLKPAGVTVAEGKIITKDDILHGKALPKPYVIKPNDEGSSVGVYIIKTDADEQKLLEKWPFDKPVLTEEYIPGRELSVVVLFDESVGIVEIKQGEGFYDYHTKYTAGVATHVIPAVLPKNSENEMKKQALIAHQVLGCKGVSRSDFRFDEATGRCVFLELNANPGMTPFSLVPEVVAKIKNLTYPELVDLLVKAAEYEK